MEISKMIVERGETYTETNCYRDYQIGDEINETLHLLSGETEERTIVCYKKEKGAVYFRGKD